ncbi:hypothetical protein G7067_12150 [Leucobacter insecticola]|uniref:Uncharacterized protein n=1 Tax=Leucobacter insecticola TaxID=2714934 RepID=A0A6G8FKU0_9MICO|nr:permease prefix domain 1-containing protein [Leucobacter insecticola]QIM16985.1 hypothetical protein G7067_12150 [Leucobacter insecticola]
MNVIIAYIDTMFSAYPQTPRLLEAKAELQGMMEDAYTGLIAEGRSENEAVGQVIRDFGKLEEVAPVLGITAELDPSPAPVGPAAAPRTLEPPVTLDEATGYSEAKRRTRFRLAAGVMLFVLSPVSLVVLNAVAARGFLPVREGVLQFAGLLLLLLCVAAGVMLMVSISRETAPFRRIEDGRFGLNPEVTRWAEAQRTQRESARIRALQFAISLWILAPIPLIAFSMILDGGPTAGLWSSVGAALVLVFVATGLGILLPQTWAHSVAEQLGKGKNARGDRANGDGSQGFVGVIAAFYWPFLTLIYLAWSFIGNAWGDSWIVWPIGAVLFAAIAAGGRALESYRKARR